MSSFPIVSIYLQGACFRPKDAPSGWAALLRFGTREKAVSGGIPIGTSNRAEILAAIEALKALKGPADVTFYTDNGVFQTGIEKLEKRRQANWMDGKSAIPNADLWREFAAAAVGHRIRSVFLPKSGSSTPHGPMMAQVNTLAKEAYLALVPAYIQSQETAAGALIEPTPSVSDDDTPF